jgi:nucleotide-binding universal stress UspA family protein
VVTTPAIVRRIVVGLDGSAASRNAAQAAAAFAASFDAEVIGVHAVGLLDVWPQEPDDHARNSHERVRALLDGPWSEPLRGGPVRYRLELHDGSPAETILAVADECEADLVVVGNRGTGDTPLGELGSTSGKIIRRSRHPVLVLPDNDSARPNQATGSHPRL